MKRILDNPPRWAMGILSCLSLDRNRDSIVDDLEIEYADLRAQRGRLIASTWYVLHVARAVPGMAFLLVYWRIIMFSNSMKSAIRQLNKHRGYSFINITGLALGMACCILILLWVQDELSYDRFHDHGDRICRIIRQTHYSDNPRKAGARVTAPLGPALKAEFAEITDFARMGRPGRRLFQYKEKSFFESRLCFADPGLLTMFSFPLVKGDSATALSDLYAIVISEEMAKKYFGEEDPIGKSLTVQQSFDVVVSGVMKTIPNNSHLKFDFLGRFEICEKEFGWGVGWSNINYTTYLQIAESVSFQQSEDKIHPYLHRRSDVESVYLFLQPLRDIYLRSDFNYDFTGGGFREKYVQIFSMISMFVLGIACINFVNLSTARSGKRAKEVGIRKVSGADRRMLIQQFLGESLTLVMLAMGLALLIVTISLPVFNHLAAKEISLFSSFNLTSLFGLAAIALFTGLASGSYPAFLLSSLKPVKVLKGTLRAGPRQSLFRKVLVVLQFTLSIILIVGTFTIYHQLGFIQNRDLGYDKEHVIVTRLFGDLKQRVETVKAELTKHPSILGATASSDITTNTQHATSGRAVWWEGKHPDENVLMYHYDIDDDFIPVMGLEIVQGRNFVEPHASDGVYNYIVNEAAVRVMNIEDPVGKQFALWGPDREGTIIGVVRDFHFKSLHDEISPFIFRVRPKGYYYLLSKVNTQNIGTALQEIETVCRRINPEHPFEYFFLDQAFDQLYRSEKRMGVIMAIFTGLAMVISSMGLLGLTSFMTEQRRKEVGIRKVLGANVSGIIGLFSKEFFILVVISNMIAWPVSYALMQRWLQGFAYRTPLGIWMFLLSAGLGMVVALGTVCYQATVAALANPVDSLKYE